VDQRGTAVLAPDPGGVGEPGSDDPNGLMGRKDFSLLVIDDSPALRRDVLRLLERVDFVARAEEAANGLEGYRKAVERPPDLVLCDLVMPSVDGFKFLSMVRSRPELSDVPVILLTGQADVETKIRGLELGASDYVTKPFDGGELLARIKVQLKIKALQDALRRSNERLRELSSVDPLTGLFNRRHFMGVLESEFKRMQRYDTPLAFVMLDIDHFKRLNDAHGHQAGDDVLRDLGGLIREQTRAADVPGRYGGEEFCVLLPQTGLKGAAGFAERVRRAVEEHRFPTEEGELRVTASLGVAACPAPGVDRAQDLIGRADDALYQAKAEGRNRVVVREP